MCKKRSSFEDRIASLLEKNKVEYEYEPKDKRLKYSVPSSTHTYTPDFVIGSKFYETKGYIRTIQERRKYVYIQEQNPDIELIMVFQNPDLPIRKGSKTTYKEWFSKRGIRSITQEELIKELKC